MAFNLGCTVTAAGHITEENFAGSPFHVHALEGCTGTVMGVDGDFLTVTWHQSGTTTDCHLSELMRTSLA